MKVCDHKHCELHQTTRGEKTRSIQVRNDGVTVKQFRYELRIFMDRQRAIEKAKAWVDERAATMELRRRQARDFKAALGIGPR